MPARLTDSLDSVPEAYPVAVTKPEASRMLRVSQWTLDRLVKSGEIPTIKIGGQVRVCTDDLRAYVDRLRAKANTPEYCEEQ